MMALDNVRAHKFRSFLTTLGVVIGVLVVILVSSILTGLRTNLIHYIEDYGTNNIYAFHLSTGISGPQDKEERTRKPLTPDDSIAVREGAPAVDEVSNVGFIEWGFDKTISCNGQTYKRGNLQGVSANYGETSNVMLDEGRFISEVDDEHRRNVMTIGVNVAEALFPHQAKIAGTQVTMGGKPFEIVGVLAKRKTGIFGENEEDNAIYIPFKTARKLSPQSQYMMIIIRARSGQI